MAKTIAFVGGGQMAEALISGLLQAGTCIAEQISVLEPNPERRSYLETAYRVTTADSAPTILRRQQTIILAVKPQVMTTVLNEIRPCLDHHLVITIAAGLPLGFYEAALGPSQRLIRVMPNTPALVQEGASALCCNTQATSKDLEFARELFNAVGTTCVVEEGLMDAVTGLSGSGPAFVFSFIEALIDGGIKAGLSHHISRELAIQTVLGAARLAKESTEHPAVLRARVTSPAGTTINGQHVLENAGFRGIVMNAVEAAVKRSTELSGA